jgi:hypothetical protein
VTSTEVKKQGKGTTTLSNTTVVLIVLTLVLTGVASFALVSYNELKGTLYKRCLATKPANDAADHFRRTEVRAFKQIIASPRIDNETRKLYQGMADDGQKAIDLYKPVDCEATYK